MILTASSGQFFRVPKTEIFRYALQSRWRVLKTEIHRIRVDGWKRRFSLKYDDVMPRFNARSLLHTIRKRYVWMEIFLNTKKKPPILKITGYVWTVKYDSKTLHLNADFFNYGGKNLRFRKYPATCGQGLSEHISGLQNTSMKRQNQRVDTID